MRETTPVSLQSKRSIPSLIKGELGAVLSDVEYRLHGRCGESVSQNIGMGCQQIASSIVCFGFLMAGFAYVTKPDMHNLVRDTEQPTSQGELHIIVKNNIRSKAGRTDEGKSVTKMGIAYMSLGTWLERAVTD